MLHFSRWKSAGILLSVLLALFFAVPNILSSAWREQLARYIPMRPITLGLDLQGGSNILLELDRKDLQDEMISQLAGDVRSALREAKIGYRSINKTAQSVVVVLSEDSDLEKARAELMKLRQPLDTGLFSTGAAVNFFDISQQDRQFTYVISSIGLATRVQRAVSQSLKIVEQRVNSIGTSDAHIQQQGRERISVQLPGIQNPEQLKNVLGRTAKLSFQLLCATQATAREQKPPPDCKALSFKDNQESSLWVQSSSRAMVDGADLKDAGTGFDPKDGKPVVTFRFNQRGALRFGTLTRDNVGKPFAIILDGVVMSIPVINTPILDGSGQILGGFTTQQTVDLSIILRSGALPAKLTIVEERTVGPTLGSDSIRAGIIASVVGLVLVLVFMVLAFGLFGLFADIALIFNLILLIAIMSLMGFTLTLPGIAGIVLTLGMAVDSNVIIFERIREEWRNGRSSLNAIETGFRTAFATIIDSNLTSLIAAIVLFGIGSGPVRGFAITHVIGILVTIYTAFTVTRWIVSYWVKRTQPKEIPL